VQPDASGTCCCAPAPPWLPLLLLLPQLLPAGGGPPTKPLPPTAVADPGGIGTTGWLLYLWLLLVCCTGGRAGVNG
jgi:hypothetical protein